MAMPVIAVIPLLGCCLLAAACANLHPEQPTTLMPEVAEACADQFPDIDLKDVTAYEHCSTWAQAPERWRVNHDF
jgi:hypothetical protein